VPPVATAEAKDRSRRGLTSHRGVGENHSVFFIGNGRQLTIGSETQARRATVPGHTEIREAIVALEARRVELETLIAEDLERSFFSRSEEIAEVVTNKVESNGSFTEPWTAKTGCSSHFTMTWFAVSTS